MKRARWIGAALLAGLGGLLWGTLGPRSSPLYCIEKSGALLGGDLGPLPAGYTPLCPDSETYRRDLREGRGRVEVYRVSGVNALALRQQIEDQTDFYSQTTDWVDRGVVLSMLRRGGHTVLYQAEVRGSVTTVTLAD